MARSGNPKSPQKRRPRSKQADERVDADDIAERLDAVRLAIREIQPELDGASVAVQLRLAELNQQLWSILSERAIHVDDNVELASVCTLREVEHHKAVVRLTKLLKVDMLRRLEQRADQQDDARGRFQVLAANAG